MKRLEDELYKYAQSDFYPFHMPGHKRQSEGEDALSEIYKMDITEIDGFDDLHHPEGILRDLMDEMSQFYGTRRTYISVNGSTAGILSAICAVANEGDSVLVARNCHKSVLNACFLKNLDVSYVVPEIVEGCDIYGGILSEKIEAAFTENSDIKAVIMTSPTYEGVVSDVKAIADVAHAHGAVLIVDEAHGAHLPFMRRDTENDVEILAVSEPTFPRSALECGADLVIQSLHKTLPAMTQTAVLHVNSERVNIDEVERYLGIFISSSPSYVLMASISKCFHYMVDYGCEEMGDYEKALVWLREKLAGLKNIGLFGENLVGKYGCLGYDIGKIVLVSRGHGRELANQLRNEYHLETEMSAPDYVICMTSLMDMKEGVVRLLDALREIDSEYEIKKADDKGSREKLPIKKLSPMEAQKTSGVYVKTEDAIGRVSKETLYVYPPGSPIIVAGEVITRQVLDKIGEYEAHGFKVHGLSKEGHILVVEEGK